MPQYLVGVEFASTHPAGDPTVLAHAVPNLHDATVLGIALCQVAVDTLTVVPDLAWDDVLALHRCPECEAEAPIIRAGRERPDGEK